MIFETNSEKIKNLKATCLQVGIVLNEEEIEQILPATKDHKQQNFLTSDE